MRKLSHLEFNLDGLSQDFGSLSDFSGTGNFFQASSSLSGQLDGTDPGAGSTGSVIGDGFGTAAYHSPSLSDPFTASRETFLDFDDGNFGGCSCVGCANLAQASFMEGSGGIAEAPGPAASLNTLADYLEVDYWNDTRGGSTGSRYFNVSDSGSYANFGTLFYNVDGWSTAKLTEGGNSNVDSNGISDARATVVRAAFAVYEQILGIDFVETTSESSGVDIFFSDNRAGANARSLMQGNTNETDGPIDHAVINITTSWSEARILQTTFHEIGHVLGLGHQGDYDGSGGYSTEALFANDSHQLSMMSYFDQVENTSITADFARLQTPMSADWLALDNIYSSQSYTGNSFGVSEAFTGNTVYGFNTNITAAVSSLYNDLANIADERAFTIVDGGGNDTVDFSGFADDQRIDVSEAYGGSTTGSISDIGGVVGNMTIGVGTIIENVRSGSGDDFIYGNAASNDFYGGDGSDSIYGYGGNDDFFYENGLDGDTDGMYGGTGTDRIILTGVGTYDLRDVNVTSIEEIEFFADGSNVDKTLWLSGKEIDQTTEFASNLLIDGNTGSGSNDRINIYLDSLYSDADLSAWQITQWNAEDSIFLYGGSEDNELTGTSADDDIYGGGGDDILTGLGGDDEIFGGTGDDSMYGGDGNDIFTFTSAGVYNDMVVDGGVGFDKILIDGTGVFDFSDIGMEFVGLEELEFGSTSGATVILAADEVNQLSEVASDFLIDSFSPATDILRIDMEGAGLLPFSAASWTFQNWNVGTDQFIIDGSSAAENITGSIQNDIIYGGQGADLLYGGLGADTIWSGGVTDGNELYGGDGGDTLGFESGTLTYNNIFDGDGGVDTFTFEFFSGNYDVNLASGVFEEIASGETSTLTEIENVNAGSGDDLLTGSSADNVINAGAGNDSVTDSAGADTVNLGDGNDTVIAVGINTDGASVYDGGSGTDTFDLSSTGFGADPWIINLDTGEFSFVTNGAASDTLINIENAIGSQAADQITGSGSANVLMGEGGDDEIYGGFGDDTLYGGAGNDIIEGGSGIDAMYGGSGDDSLSIGFGSVGHIANGGAGSDTIDFSYSISDWEINLTTGETVLSGDNYTTLISIENVVGGDGIDLIIGTVGANSLSGGAGDDDIRAGSGNDQAFGGDGMDRIFGQDDDDILEGDAGDDTLFGGTGEDTLYGGADDDLMYGQADNDYLLGESGEDTMIGGAGDDVLDGGDDNDFLSGQIGNDLMYGRAGDDLLSSQAGNDELYGGTGNDTLNAGGGDDFVYGGDQDDILNGATGTDLLYGGFGNDTLNGGGQNDELHGDAGNDIVNGSAGNDEVYGEAGSDTVSGQAGADFLYGGDDNDVLFGGGGSDDLYGGAGNDVLSGGGGIGNDELWGDAGSDIFDMDQGFRVDRIKDFENGSDLIDFSGNALANDFASVLAASSQVGTTVRIELNANNTVIIENFDLADLDATDFIF